MNLVVTIDSTDRTNYIDWQSFVKEDILNNQVDTCSFETKKYGSKTWKPAVGDEIEITDGGTKIFAGVIVRVVEVIEGKLLKYQVDCKDWTHYLDKQIVNERYEDETIEDIIDDINSNYLSGFTIANVACEIEVDSITFNRISVSRCLQILADLINYNWYVDYDKDIHFFAKNTEISPFDLTDTNGKYVFQSLKITDDLSQMRNKVYIRGGEIEATSTRDKTYTGDGTNTNFETGYKFASKPTVTVNSVAQTVGTEFLDASGYDCYWNYNEKYIRFGTAPTNGHAIVITGTPLIPIIVEALDDASIDLYGTYEFAKTNKELKTRDEARQYAAAELEAYGAKLQEAYFETYESGLRSGQIINIQSDIRSLNEDFLIQRVTLRMRTPTEGVWSVELATMRTVGIIEILQRLLSDDKITYSEDEVLERHRKDYQTVEVTEEISRHTPYEDHQTVNVAESIEKDPMGGATEPDWVLAPYVPSSHSDPKREGRLDISFKVY